MSNLTNTSDGIENWWERRPTYQKALIGVGGVAAAVGAVAVVLMAAPVEGVIFVAGPVLFASGQAAVQLAKG